MYSRKKYRRRDARRAASARREAARRSFTLVRAHRVSRAYITHSPVRHASRVTVQRVWKCKRVLGGKRESRTIEREMKMRKRAKGCTKWGHPSSPGRCFRLRRPCRLINNTISPFLRAFLSFSSASASSSSSSPSRRPPPPSSSEILDRSQA